MKLELKAIKYSATMSRGTHCYSAALYVNGKRIAIVENDGGGASDSCYPAPKVAPEVFQKTMREVDAYFAALSEKEGRHQTLEWWCCDRVNDWLMEKHARNLLRKVMIVEDGKVMVYSRKSSDESFKAAVRAQGKELLNDKPLEEVVAILRAAA